MIRPWPLLAAGAAVLTLTSCDQALAQPGPRDEALVQVVVAARDLAAGDQVKPEDVTQREVPASLATSSVVRPNEASTIINQHTALPMLRGDLVTWAFFETLRDPETYQACQKLAAEPESAAEQVARARQRILAR